MGIDPRPFSLRELAWMVDGRQLSEWGRTSHVLAMMANTAFTSKKRKAWQPYEFNPFAKQLPRPRMSKQETKATLRAMVGIQELTDA